MNDDDRFNNFNKKKILLIYHKVFTAARQFKNPLKNPKFYK